MQIAFFLPDDLPREIATRTYGKSYPDGGVFELPNTKDGIISCHVASWQQMLDLGEAIAAAARKQMGAMAHELEKEVA